MQFVIGSDTELIGLTLVILSGGGASPPQSKDPYLAD